MFTFALTPDREVLTDWNVTLPQYADVMSFEEMDAYQSLASQFKDKRIMFISATPQGGGVALMRHTLIHLFKLAQVNAHWHILLPDSDVFEVTKKKIHNVLQAVAPEGVVLTDEDKQLYEEWTAKNALILRSAFKLADVVIIDDPQPAGLIPHIKYANPNAKIMYRSHIQIEARLVDIQGTPQYVTWSYLWRFIQWVDLFISHPVESFVPSCVKNSSVPVVYMPATTDPLDGLNEGLTEEQIDEKMAKFNALLIADGQAPLDFSCPYIIQYARFDPSKGLPDVIESYAKFRRLLPSDTVIPQLVIAGNGSIDDPDGVPLLIATKALVDILYPEYAQDIKILRLDADDRLANALLRKAWVVLQLSHKEGFEVKVTEALMKGKPVIAYKAGGIPLQIKNPHNGYLVDVGNTDVVANHLLEFATNPCLYDLMQTNIKTGHFGQYQTVQNATRWLSVGSSLLGLSQQAAS